MYERLYDIEYYNSNYTEKLIKYIESIGGEIKLSSLNHDASIYVIRAFIPDENVENLKKWNANVNVVFASRIVGI